MIRALHSAEERSYGEEEEPYYWERPFYNTGNAYFEPLVFGASMSEPAAIATKATALYEKIVNEHLETKGYYS